MRTGPLLWNLTKIILRERSQYVFQGCLWRHHGRVLKVSGNFSEDDCENLEYFSSEIYIWNRQSIGLTVRCQVNPTWTMFHKKMTSLAHDPVASLNSAEVPSLWNRCKAQIRSSCFTIGLVVICTCSPTLYWVTGPLWLFWLCTLLDLFSGSLHELCVQPRLGCFVVDRLVDHTRVQVALTANQSPLLPDAWTFLT